MLEGVAAGPPSRAVHPFLRGARRRIAGGRASCSTWASPRCSRARCAPRIPGSYPRSGSWNRSSPPCRRPSAPRSRRGLRAKLDLEIDLLDAGDISGAAAARAGPRELEDDAGNVYFLWHSRCAARRHPHRARSSRRAKASLDAVPAVLFYASILLIVGLWLRPLLRDLTVLTVGVAEVRDRLSRAARHGHAHHAAHEPRDQSRRHVRAREPAHPVAEGNDRRVVARDAHAAGARAFRRRGARRRSGRSAARAAARRERRRAADRRPDLRHARLRAARSSRPAHELPERAARAVAAAACCLLLRRTNAASTPCSGTASKPPGWSRASWSSRSATCWPMRCATRSRTVNITDRRATSDLYRLVVEDDGEGIPGRRPRRRSSARSPASTPAAIATPADSASASPSSRASRRCIAAASLPAPARALGGAKLALEWPKSVPGQSVPGEELRT